MTCRNHAVPQKCPYGNRNHGLVWIVIQLTVWRQTSYCIETDHKICSLCTLLNYDAIYTHQNKYLHSKMSIHPHSCLNHLAVPRLPPPPCTDLLPQSMRVPVSVLTSPLLSLAETTHKYIKTPLHGNMTSGLGQ